MNGPICDKTIRKQVFSLSWPAILEMTLHMMVGIVDTAMVGRLGAVSLAAVGLGSQLYFFSLFVLASIGTGCSVLVARHIGAGDRPGAELAAGQSLLIGLVFGVLLASGAYFLSDDFFALYPAEPEVAIQAAEYLSTASFAAVPTLLLFIINALFRGAGNTRLPLYIAVVTNTINIAGDYLFIFGEFGFPRLEVAGAALATGISGTIGFWIMVFILIRGGSSLSLNHKHIFPVRRKILRKIVELSIPAGIDELSFTLGGIAGSFILTSLGAVAFAANQVALTIESLSFMPGFGFTIATATLVGQNLGAGRGDLAVKSVREAARIAVSIMSIMGLIFLLLPYFLVQVFTNQPEVFSIAVICVRIAAFEQPTIAIELVLGGALRGAGDTKSPMIVSTLGMWLFRLPLFFVFIYTLKYSAYYAWIISVIDWMLRSLLIYWIYRRGKWQEIALAYNN